MLLCSLLFAKAFDFFLNKYIKKLAAKTKTALDDILLVIVRKPIYILIIVIGLYFSIKSLSVINSYDLWVDSVFFVISVLVIALFVTRMLSVFVSR